ncbi:YidH family protein [Oerskovia sp. NPDC056781]|uniref:YidH family protein n=1 Tax=Oerskovia sp. NPDC056781 TaxID=3345942 RepID=UPI003670CCFC
MTAQAGEPSDDAATRGPGAPPPDDRRPRSVYGVGEEPDIRFSLANERTALAWVRTGLGLVAGGVALTSFASFASMSGFVDVIAAVACLAGAGFAAYALLAWRRNERAMRRGEPLPAPTGLPVLVAGVLVLALLVAGYAVTEVWRT